MPFELAGYVFPTADEPAHGPMVEITPQRWSEQNPLGVYGPGTILTLLGTTSQRWPLISRADINTLTALVNVFNASVPVLFKTPQNGTGFNVVMTDLFVEYETPIERSKYLCRFTLVRR